jgi:hypothetical protein
MNQNGSRFMLPFGNKIYCHGSNQGYEFGVNKFNYTGTVLTIQLPVNIKSINVATHATLIVGEGNNVLFLFQTNCNNMIELTTNTNNKILQMVVYGAVETTFMVNLVKIRRKLGTG